MHRFYLCSAVAAVTGLFLHTIVTGLSLNSTPKLCHRHPRKSGDPCLSQFTNSPSLGLWFSKRWNKNLAQAKQSIIHTQWVNPIKKRANRLPEGIQSHWDRTETSLRPHWDRTNAARVPHEYRTNTALIPHELRENTRNLQSFPFSADLVWTSQINAEFVQN